MLFKYGIVVLESHTKIKCSGEIHSDEWIAIIMEPFCIYLKINQLLNLHFCELLHPNLLAS